MTEIIIPIITGIVCLAVGVVIGFLYRKSVAEKAIGDAETEATRIINEAIKAVLSRKCVWCLRTPKRACTAVSTYADTLQ